MASLAVGIAGAAIGSLFGMPALGFAIGSAIGSALFPQKGPDGPRLQDLRLQTSSYGKMIPFLFGAMRVGGNVIWTTDLKEHKNKSGGKGGPSVTTYTYTASFAVLFCEGPANSIRRIWADSTLVYSTDPADGVLPTIPVTIYLGTDAQSPDPTMESILGVGFVPANNGYVYIVFTDWDLGNFGNRLPSLNAEILSGPPSVEVARYIVSHNDAVAYYTSPAAFISTGAITTGPRIATYTPILSGADIYNPDLTFNSHDPTNIPADSFPYAVSGSSGRRYNAIGTFAGVATWFQFGAGPDPWFTTGGDGTNAPCLATGAIDFSSGPPTTTFDLGSLLPAGQYVNGAAITSDQSAMFLFTAASHSVACTDWYKITGAPGSFIVAAAGTISGGAQSETLAHWGTQDELSGGKVIVAENDQLHFWTVQAHWIEKVLEIAGSVLQIDALATGAGALQYDFSSGGVHPSVFSPAIGYLYVVGTTSLALASRLTPAPTSVTLASIVTALSERAGLLDSDIDVTQLVDYVDGYLIEQQSAARDCITPLQSAYFFDGVESNAKMKFVKRGGQPTLSIPDADLAAAPTDSSPPALLPWKRAQEVDLPATLAVSYVNGNGAYQVGTQYARRLVTSSQLILTSSLAINMTDAKANSVAWTLLIAAWMERETFTVSVPRKYWYLEPTDVIQAHGFTMRVTGKRDRLDGVIELDGVATQPSLWIQGPTSGGAGTGGGTNTPPALQPTNLLLLDIPLLVDLDVQAGFYAAYAGSVNPTWRGAALWKSYDLGATFAQVDAVTTANTIGTAATSLPPFGGGNIFDELNVLTVVIGAGGGDLAGDSEINVLNGSNAALVGDEIIQYKNAVLTAPNTYSLSGMLRGRRGTEWAMSTHGANDRFVVLPVDDIASPQSDVGSPLTYKGVTQGDSLGNTAAQTFENTGTGARCYAPVQVYGTVNASTGDVAITWVRRTRVGGQWQNMTDVPLSEAAELYVVQIWNSDYTLCARIIAGITSPAVVYTGAQQVTDFGAEQLSLFVTVGQIGLFGLGTQAGAILAGNGSTIDAPLNPVTPYNNPPPVAPPTGGCTGTVYSTTIPWTLGDGGIILAPSGFDKNSKWVQKISIPGSGSFRIRIFWFEYGGVPGERHVSLSTIGCGAPLIPAVKQDLFYPQIYAYVNATNPYPTQFATLLLGTDYYFTITVDDNGSLPMAYECQIEAI